MCARSTDFIFTVLFADTASRSRRVFSREVCSLVRLPLKRGRRECRALDAPASRVCNGSGRAHTRSSGHTGETRHSPRNGLRLISRSPRRPGFLATVARRVAPANLTPASGRQDHTTLPSARNAFVFGAFRVHRIPLPTSVTIASRPSLGNETAGVVRVIWVSRETKYFCKGGLDDPNHVDRKGEFFLCAHALLRL